MNGLVSTLRFAHPAFYACSGNVAKSQNIRYAASVAKQKHTTGKRTNKGFVIGAAGFAKISAVEGIRLKPAMKKRALEADRKGLSAEETRRAIIRSYRKG